MLNTSKVSVLLVVENARAVGIVHSIHLRARAWLSFCLRMIFSENRFHFSGSCSSASHLLKHQSRGVRAHDLDAAAGRAVRPRQAPDRVRRS